MFHGERIQFASLTRDECARHNDELNADVPESRLPSTDELRLIREVIDPNGVRKQEVRG